MEHGCKPVNRPCQTSPLLNSPDDILIIILELLSSCDLFALATLCKRLHFIALPVYYQFHNASFSSSSELVLDQDRFNALPGLLISLAPKTFRRLRCTFPSHEFAFLASVRRVGALLKQLTHLTEVVFEFRLIESPYSLHGYYHRERLYWREPLEKLMAAVAASTCASITIRGDINEQSRPPSLSSLHYSLLPSSPSTTSRLVSKLLKSYKNTKKLCKGGKSSQCVSVPEMATIPSFHTVNISSSIQILPRWTMQMFNSTSITTLSISNPSHCNSVTSRDWGDVLASIHMPLLQNLIIKLCPITFETLSHILNRHPLLISLTIDALGHGVDHWFPIGIGTRAPNLISLAAPVPYIPQFLTHAEVAPKLDNLTILAADACGRDGVSTEFARVWWGALDVVAERIRTCKLALDIDLPYYSSFEHVVIGGGKNVACRYLAKMERLVVRPGDYGEYLMRENWASFRQWLECFPALVELEIEGGSMDEEARKAFVCEMMPVFTRVATVKLHGRDL